MTVIGLVKLARTVVFPLFRPLASIRRLLPNRGPPFPSVPLASTNAAAQVSLAQILDGVVIRRRHGGRAPGRSVSSVTTQPDGVRGGSPWTALAACAAVAAIWLAMPSYTLGEAGQRAWLDQSILLACLEELIAPGSGDRDLAAIGTGPAYLAAARLLTVAGLEPASALVLLSRLALLAALLLTLSAAFGLSRRRIEVSWPSFWVVTLLALLVPLPFLSGIPWTHFPATALGLTLVAGVRAWSGHRLFSAAVVGGSIAALLQTRNFEAQVMAASVLVVVVGVMLRRRSLGDPRTLLTPAIVLLASFASVWVLCGIGGGQWLPYSQYSAQWTALDRVLSVESLVGSVPQMFIDPCFATPCASGGAFEHVAVVPTSTEAWSAPLLHQLPSLVVGLLAGWLLLLERVVARRPVPADIWVAMLSSSALVVGYLANPIMGGPHLRYGVVRDFILPALLSVYAVGRLVRSQNRDDRGTGSRRAWANAVAISAFTLLVAVVPLPRLESDPVTGYALAPSTCTSWPCSFDVTIVRASGRSVAAQGTVIVVPFCDGARLPRIDPQGPIPAASCDGVLELGVLPRSFGAWQTPEGEDYLRSHVIRVSG